MSTETGAPLDPPAAGGGENDEIVGGPRTHQQIAAQKRLQQHQAQVDEVVNIMAENVEKVIRRDEMLSTLDEKADALQEGAGQFEQQAGKLKRKFWLQNLKMMIIMGVIGLVIVAIIVMKFMPNKDAAPQPYIPPGGYPQPAPGQVIQPAPQVPPAGTNVSPPPQATTGGGTKNG